MKTFKEFIEALLAGKEVVNRHNGDTLSITERGGLQMTDGEDGDLYFLEQGDFSIDDEMLGDYSVKEKCLVVKESELSKLVEELTKVKTKEGLTKKLASLLKVQ